MEKLLTVRRPSGRNPQDWTESGLETCIEVNN